MSERGQGVPFEPGDRIGRYRITRVLGEGGMGIVYEGIHEELHKRVAIKTLHAARGPYSADALERFVREGQAAARIHHPNVVDVVDVGVQDGRPFLVMEFLEGEDLASFIETRSPLAPGQLVDLILPIVSALSAAHRAHIVHRDLKPENIFLTRDASQRAVPKLVDFGISKLRQEGALTLTGTHAVLGTPYYMSPEQARSARDVDHRSDIFSLGVILYQCLTHALPFKGDSLFELLEAIVHSEPPPIRASAANVPQAMEATITRALQKDREARFASMAELGAALLPFASERVRLHYADEFGHPHTSGRALTGEPDSAVVALSTSDMHASTIGPRAIRAQPRQPTTHGRARLVLLVSTLSAATVLGLYVLARPTADRHGTSALDADPGQDATPPSALPSDPARPTAVSLAAAQAHTDEVADGPNDDAQDHQDAGVSEAHADREASAPDNAHPRPDSHDKSGKRNGQRQGRAAQAPRATDQASAPQQATARVMRSDDLPSAKGKNSAPPAEQGTAPAATQLAPIAPPTTPAAPSEEDLFGDRK